MRDLTHADIVERAVRWLRNTRKCRVVFAEITTSAAAVPDAIGWAPWHRCILIECKVSRSDYRADEHKLSHRAGRLPGAERWYMTPPGLLQPDEVREGWGLLEVHGRTVRRIVEAPPVPEDDRCWRDEMTILLSAVRRHELGVEWRHDAARFAPYGEARARFEVAP